MAQMKPGTKVHQLYQLLKDWPKAFTMWDAKMAAEEALPGAWDRAAIRSVFIKMEDYGKIARTGFKQRNPRNKARNLLWYMTKVPLDVALDGVVIAGRKPNISQAQKQKYKRQAKAEKKRLAKMKADREKKKR